MTKICQTVTRLVPDLRYDKSSTHKHWFLRAICSCPTSEQYRGRSRPASASRARKLEPSCSLIDSTKQVPITRDDAPWRWPPRSALCFCKRARKVGSCPKSCRARQTLCSEQLFRRAWSRAKQPQRLQLWFKRNAFYLMSCSCFICSIQIA